MKKIRIKNTIGVAAEVLTDGNEVSLVGRDIHVLLTDPRGASFEMPWHIDEEHNNVVRFNYEGTDQQWTGTYRVEVWENKGNRSQAIFDKEAFTLVPRTELADDIADNLATYQVQLTGGAILIGGKDGVGIRNITYIGRYGAANRYEIELTDGNTFTFDANDGAKGDQGNQGVGIVNIRPTYMATNGTQYIIELSDGTAYPFFVPKGDKGEKGDRGIQGEKGEQGEKGAKGDAGNDGVGISQIYLNYVGETYRQYVIRLSNGRSYSFEVDKGDKGDTGAQGIQGERGEQGYTPYIQDEYWYINGVNTGVKATSNVTIDLQDLRVDSETGQLYVEV